MNVYLPNLRLPSAYQEVEWIGRNGNNYIDTGWIPNLSNTFEVRIGYKIADSGYRYGILSNYNGYVKSVSFELNASNETGNKARFYIENWASSGSDMVLFSSTGVSTSTFSDVVYKSTTSTKTVSVNGTESSLSNSFTGTNGTTAYLFIDRNLRWSTFSHNSFISYCKIYESGTLVRDFVPCYRKSDNIIGLYDLVNNQFYTNSGTGTFSKGNDVTMTMLKNAYIGEYIEETYTISDVPDGDVNKYISIAKSGYKVSKVVFKYSNTISSSGRADERVRISGSNNTTNRYGIGFSYDVIQVSGRINGQDDSYFFETNKNTGTTNTEFTITRDNWTLVCSGANTLNQTSTMGSSEKNIIATIMNSNTINAYCSRDNGTVVSDVIVTVTYEPN